MKHIPTRTCIVCRTPKDKPELLRIVRSPEGKIFADTTGKAAGRGCYVCAAEACFNKMVDKKFLARAFKQDVPREVYEAIKEKGFGIKQ